MPIRYVVDADQRLIFEIWTGTISAAELGEFWTTLLADPAATAVRRTLTDLREATFAFSSADLANLVQNVLLPRIGTMDWKSAIVVKQLGHYGRAYEFHVLAEQFSRDALFEDYDQALAWIKLQ